MLDNESAAAMQRYLDLLSPVMETGTDRGDRTGTGTRGVFGCRMRFGLSEGFPVTTARALRLRSVVHELLRFLKGGTDIAYLHESGVILSAIEAVPAVPVPARGSRWCN